MLKQNPTSKNTLKTLYCHNKLEIKPNTLKTWKYYLIKIETDLNIYIKNNAKKVKTNSGKILNHKNNTNEPKQKWN